MSSPNPPALETIISLHVALKSHPHSMAPPRGYPNQSRHRWRNPVRSGPIQIPTSASFCDTPPSSPCDPNTDPAIRGGTFRRSYRNTCGSTAAPRARTSFPRSPTPSSPALATNWCLSHSSWDASEEHPL